MNLFRTSIEAASDEDGWANLAVIGSNIVKQAPEFDPRNYGYTKLSDLAIALGHFEIQREDKKILMRNSAKK